MARVMELTAYCSAWLRRHRVLRNRRVHVLYQLNGGIRGSFHTRTNADVWVRNNRRKLDWPWRTRDNGRVHSILLMPF